MKRNRQILCLLLIIMSIAWGRVTAAPQKVHIIPIQGDIELGLARFVDRAFNLAERSQSNLIIIDIGTLGGRVDAALAIRDRIERSSITTVAYVRDRAISAGALITLACDQIIMTPTATIGAAEPYQGDQPAEEKIVSFWREEMAETARRNRRDPDLAAAMVDKDVEIVGVVAKGKLLTLAAPRAVELGLADALASNDQQLWDMLGITNANIVNINPSISERLARLVVSPLVSTLLLTIGFGGFIIELISPGFGVPGASSLVAWGLFFGGHWIAGIAGWEVILLFLLGLVLLAAEAVVPGFGIMGLGGIASVIFSIVLAVGDKSDGLQSLLISLIIVAIIVAVLIRNLGRRGLWQRIILTTQLSSDEGFQSSPSYMAILGQQGQTVSPLRPSGTAIIGGQRMNVVSQGEFIPAKTNIVVKYVEGNRVVVEELSQG